MYNQPSDRLTDVVKEVAAKPYKTLQNKAASFFASTTFANVLMGLFVLLVVICIGFGYYQSQVNTIAPGYDDTPRKVIIM